MFMTPAEEERLKKIREAFRVVYDDKGSPWFPLEDMIFLSDLLDRKIMVDLVDREPASPPIRESSIDGKISELNENYEELRRLLELQFEGPGDEVINELIKKLVHRIRELEDVVYRREVIKDMTKEVKRKLEELAEEERRIGLGTPYSKE